MTYTEENAPAAETAVDETTLVERTAPEEIRTAVTVHGNLTGQLAVGNNIVQMRIDRVTGNVVNVLPPGSLPRVTERPGPVRLLPRRPDPMFDRVDETAEVTREAAAGRPVAVHAASGAGKSTLLRHLAHQAPLTEACGGVAHLPARGQSRNDLLQALFEVFYSSDIPVRPTVGELRHHLQHVRAALLLDDVEISDEEAAELADFAPGCAFVLAGSSAHSGRAVSVPLPGLPDDAAARLFALALGRTPVDQDAVHRLCRLSDGVPGALVQLGVEAGHFAGSLGEFAAAALVRPPALDLDSRDDMRVVGLLAALPGVELDVAQLTAITGLPDVQRRLDRWLARGLVTASADPDRTRYGLTTGIQLDEAAWQLEERREDLHRHLASWAGERRAALVPGPATEAVRIVHADAKKRGYWRSILALGALLEAAYAVTGRWDAWQRVAHDSLDAAHALADPHAEGMALHQLGTHALCVGDTAVATNLLRQALDLRTRIGDTAGVQATQHNLSLLVAPPLLPDDHRDGGHDGGSRVNDLLRRVPMSAKILAVLAPLAGALTFIGTAPGATSSFQVEPTAMQFAVQPLNQSSTARTVTLGNRGSSAVQIDGVDVTGRDKAEFTVAGSTCSGEVPAARSCVTTVVFTPTGAGDREASLHWDVRGATVDPVATLTGSGSAAAPSITVAPRALVFDGQPVNVSSAPQRIQLTAPADRSVELRTVTVDGVQAGDFAVDNDTCSGARLAPGAYCATTVRFTPAAEGSRSALLTVPRADGEDAVSVPLVGSGTAPTVEPDVRVLPSSLDFGDQAVATGSAAQRVTVSNEGPAPVTVDGATITGATDFATTGSDCPATLAPGARCTVDVVFAPTAVGQRTAELAIRAPGGPSVPLRGTGVPAPPLVPELTPSSLDFGEQRVGQRSVAQTITVTNRATVPITLTGAAVAGTKAGFEIDSAACTTAAVPAGGSCRISVTFAPTVAGPHTGVLTLTVDGVAGRPTVTLAGTGTAPATPLVPNVVGMPQADAERALTAAGYQPGVIMKGPSAVVPVGAVAEQRPVADTPLTAGGAVDLVISSGPATTTVPVVVGSTQAEAERLLGGAQLRVGDVTSRPDPSAAAGIVLESTPPAGAPANIDSAVALVVSTGPPVVRPRVPDVVDRPVDDARALLSGVGLTADPVTSEASETVPAGSVIRSTPPAGTEVDPNSAVGLVVSTGPAPVIVPDVVGMSERVATDVLNRVPLAVGQVRRQSDEQVPEGAVISTTPTAGAQAARNSTVDLVVSTGPALVAVPVVVGKTEADAGTALTAAGLTKGDVQVDSNSKEPAGTVVRSTPDAGVMVRKGTAVGLVLAPVIN